MNTSTALTFLQALASMLTIAHQSSNLTPAMASQMVSITSRGIQLAVQAEEMPNIPFQIPPNDSAAPSIEDLLQTAYLATNGSYVPAIGSSVSVIQGDTSFGDLNGDGFDDAVTVVERSDSTGATTFALATLLNQGGIMFNISDVPLGSSVQVNSHNIVQGGDLVINMSVDGASAQTSTYQLVGTQLLKVN